MLGSNANSIFFDVLRNTVSFDQVAQTSNQKAAASGTQSLGTGNKIFDTVLMLDAPNARRAFDLLSGEIHASVSGTILEDSRFIRDAVTGRLRQGIGGAASIFAPQLATMNFSEDGNDADTDVAGLMFEGDAMAYSPAKRKRVRDTMDRALPLKAAPVTRGPVYAAWGQAFGNFGRTDGDGNAAALRHTTGGFITGMDVTTRGSIGDVWRAGLAVGFQHTSVDVSDRSSSGGVETYYLAAYGGRQIGALGLRAGASYGWHDVSTNRSIVIPGFTDTTKGRYNANTAQVFGEVGYGMQWRQFAIEPFAGIAYVNLHTDSFVEGGGAAALAGAGGTTDTTYSTIGLRAAAPLPWRDLAGLVAKGSIGWRHNLGTGVPTAQLSFASGSTPFVVAGVPIARDAAAVEVGLEGQVWRNATLGIAYTGQIASSADDHGVNANFVQKF
jgi:outer membrane autotransporter protein